VTEGYLDIGRMDEENELTQLDDGVYELKLGHEEPETWTTGGDGVDVVEVELDLRKRVMELEETLELLHERHWDAGAIRGQNNLRRAKGSLKQLEIEAALGVERVPWAEKVWYDGYQAYIKARPPAIPNPLYRLIRVFDEDGDVLEENAILCVHLTMFENFWPRDTVYVEPSPTLSGKWQLVGEYNFKGMRIG